MDERGLDRVLAGVRKYEKSLGDYGRTWFIPSPLLESMVAAQMTFREYDLNVNAQLG
jgi:3-hydroxyacyl-CoA dehydrogenase